MAEGYYTSSKYKVLGPLGPLAFQLKAKRHKPAQVASSDTQTGHINHLNGNTIYVPPLTRDDFPPNLTNLETASYANRTDVGGYSRVVRDTTVPITPITEPATATNKNLKLWERKKLPGGGRSIVRF